MVEVLQMSANAPAEVYFSCPSRELKDTTLLVAADEKFERIDIHDARDGIISIIPRTCAGNSHGKTSIDLLNAFSYKLELRQTNVPLFVTIGAGIAAHFFKAANGDGTFERSKLPFGLVGLKQVDWERESKRPTFSNNEDQKMRLYPGVVVERDCRMIDSGIIRFNFWCGSRNNFAFHMFWNIMEAASLVTQNISDDAREDLFDSFEMIVLIALEILTQVQVFLQEARNQRPEVVMVETIKRAEFFHLTVPLDFDDANEIASDNDVQQVCDSNGYVAPADRATSTSSSSYSQGRPTSPSIGSSEFSLAASTLKAHTTVASLEEQPPTGKGNNQPNRPQASKKSKRGKRKNKKNELRSETTELTGTIDPVLKSAQNDSNIPANADVIMSTNQTLNVNSEEIAEGRKGDTRVAKDDGEVPTRPLTSLRDWKFDSNHSSLRCRVPDCLTTTSCWDSKVVICPACGPRALVRYCNKQHLYDDIQRHWAEECCRRNIVDPIDDDTIRPENLPKAPYVYPTFHNNVERHRQAVYRATEGSGFFVFADIEEIEGGLTSTPTLAEWTLVRGRGKMVCRVLLTDDGHFEDLLNNILRGPVDMEDCDEAFELLREALMRENCWSEGIFTYLTMQLAGEWGFRVLDSMY